MDAENIWMEHGIHQQLKKMRKNIIYLSVRLYSIITIYYVILCLGNVNRLHSFTYTINSTTTIAHVNCQSSSMNQKQKSGLNILFVGSHTRSDPCFQHQQNVRDLQMDGSKYRRWGFTLQVPIFKS